MLVTACVLLGSASATAEDGTGPAVAWDAASFTAERGVETTISGVIVEAGADAHLVVEKLVDGDWSAVPSQLEAGRFVAVVPGEAATYRAVLSGPGTDVSAVTMVVAEAARSDLRITLPSSAEDGSQVTAHVSWQRVADGAPLSGQVALVFRRRGLETWKTLPPVDVVDGAAQVALTPRDDGSYRVLWAGSPEIGAVESSPAAFDNVPVRSVVLRIGQYNLPGPDKLSRSSTRAVKAAQAIKAADIDVMTFNELVGPGHNSTTNPPSSFARTVLRALGSKWRLITPTMTYNENYIAYRPDRVEVIVQYADRVVPGIGTGSVRKKTARHVTPVLFKDRGSNQPVLIAATHLVSGSRAGARTQAYAVGRHAAELSNGYPVVVGGDMNTSDKLAGLTGRGLKDVRRAAKQRTNATYVKYSKTRPVKDATWIIDQIYAPTSWTVSRWVTALGTRNGRFTTPRASDHLLVWSTLKGPRP